MTLYTAHSGEYDPENSYEKPSAILKMVPKAGYGRYKNQPIAVKQRRKSTKGREENYNQNSDEAFETIFRNTVLVSVFKRSKTTLYSLSLEKGSHKISKLFAHG